jgi:hypothetical protein
LAAYLEALKLLPETTPVSKPPPPPPTGVEELTDEQAAVLENEIRERELESSRPDAVTRRSLERQIDDARKALWSNIGAVYVKKVSKTNQPRPHGHADNQCPAQGDDKEAVNACTEGKFHAACSLATLTSNPDSPPYRPTLRQGSPPPRICQRAPIDLVVPDIRSARL